MNKQTSPIVCLLSFAVIVPSIVWADISIDAGTHEVSLGQASVDIPVMISSTANDQATDMVGYVQIGDGGTLLGKPSDGPMITDVDYGNSIWEDAAGGFTSFFGSVGPTAQVIDPQVSLNVAGESVAASGTVFNLTVNLAGFTDTIGNSYPIFLSNVAIGAENAVQNAGTSIDAILIDGSIVVVPEPTSAWPLLFGCVTFLMIHFRASAPEKRGISLRG